MKQAVIILNPWAGRGTAGARRGELEAALRAAGIRFDLLTTHARGGATELAWQSVERGYEQIIAVGGDGTINEVVNGLRNAELSLGRRVPLGIVPLGTGSDFIKSLDGIARDDLAGAVARIARRQAKPVDIVQVRVDDQEPRYYVNALGMGLDAQVAAESLKITRIKGMAVYFLAIFRALTNYKAYPMTVRYDDQRVQRRLLFASIANGRCQGGGFYLTPNAQIDDGLLDLCIVDHLRLDRIMYYLPKLLDGSHVGQKGILIDRARTVTIESSGPMPVAVDGEVISTDARMVSVEIVPQGIDVLF